VYVFNNGWIDEWKNIELCVYAWRNEFNMETLFTKQHGLWLTGLYSNKHLLLGCFQAYCFCQECHPWSRWFRSLWTSSYGIDQELQG
jgi:hypothetical protein